MSMITPIKSEKNIEAAKAAAQLEHDQAIEGAKKRLRSRLEHLAWMATLAGPAQVASTAKAPARTTKSSKSRTAAAPGSLATPGDAGPELNVAALVRSKLESNPTERYAVTDLMAMVGQLGVAGPSVQYTIAAALKRAIKAGRVSRVRAATRKNPALFQLKPPPQPKV